MNECYYVLLLLALLSLSIYLSSSLKINHFGFLVLLFFFLLLLLNVLPKKKFQIKNLTLKNYFFFFEIFFFLIIPSLLAVFIVYLKKLFSPSKFILNFKFVNSLQVWHGNQSFIEVSISCISNHRIN